MKPLHLDIACNDPANGAFIAKAPQLMIGDAEFECRGAPPTFRYHPTGFSLSGKYWPVRHTVGWIGNWCWDRVYFGSDDQRSPDDVFIDFVIWLQLRNNYRCTLGTKSFVEWFNRARWPMIMSDGRLLETLREQMEIH